MTTLINTSDRFNHFLKRVRPLLKRVYGEDAVQPLAEKIFKRMQDQCAESVDEDLHKWSQDNILLITYGDSIVDSHTNSSSDPQELSKTPDNQHETPLASLLRFLETYLYGTITGVHILPFFPFSSDDGFAVIDYCTVNPKLGTWPDIQALAEKFNLMFDLVVNHVSSQHQWFEQFRQHHPPGQNYFIIADPNADLSEVVRPRSSPLLVPVDTVDGTQHVWATFSADQVDLNFANPDVLLEIIDVILFYVQMGARYLRLDAVGFLWKRLGTTCIHLPETHALIRLMREILQMIDPGIALITETNVPNRENLSYFGNRNEAHMIYNFSLPPLLLNALLQGRSDHLKTWMMSMPPAPLGCAYFNFIASHDGMGLRPAEGLLTDDEYDQLLDTMKAFGGRISMRRRPDGTESPYEVNISLFDALKGTVRGEDEWQIDRFLCAQSIMLSLEGIPAFYIHSFLATSNDQTLVEKTGRNRSINRHQWQYQELEALLKDPDSPNSQVMNELSRRIKIRRQQPAFHPNATQYTLHPMNKAIFAFWRQSMTRDQSIFSIHNLSDRPQVLPLLDLNLIITDPWLDLLSGQLIEDIHDTFTLQPYQSAWITNKFGDTADADENDDLS